MTITKAQANTLRKILALGGSARPSCGRLTGDRVHKMTIRRLESAGMVEIVTKYLRPEHVVPSIVGIYVTAKGCNALNAFETANAIIE